jgi:uncharacterized protein YjbI with pentapeptide repeats
MSKYTINHTPNLRHALTLGLTLALSACAAPYEPLDEETEDPSDFEAPALVNANRGCPRLETPIPPGSTRCGQDLRGADFRDTDLSGANFAYADLTGASFIGAQLRGVNFTGAIMTDTQFARACGLEELIFDDPEECAAE